MQLAVLFIEDNPDDVELMLRHLRRAGIEPRWRRVATEAAVREALVEQEWGVALVDYNLPSFGGRRALEIIAEAAPALPAITVSGAISEATAVATLTAGATDYVLKDNLTRLVPAVRRAVEGADLRRRERAADELARQSQFAVEHSSQAIVYVDENGRHPLPEPGRGGSGGRAPRRSGRAGTSGAGRRFSTRRPGRACGGRPGTGRYRTSKPRWRRLTGGGSWSRSRSTTSSATRATS